MSRTAGHPSRSPRSTCGILPPISKRRTAAARASYCPNPVFPPNMALPIRKTSRPARSLTATICPSSTATSICLVITGRWISRARRAAAGGWVFTTRTARIPTRNLRSQRTSLNIWIRRATVHMSLPICPNIWARDGHQKFRTGIRLNSSNLSNGQSCAIMHGCTAGTAVKINSRR